MMSVRDITSLRLSETQYLITKGDITFLYSPLDKMALKVQPEGIEVLSKYFLEGEENIELKKYLNEKGVGENHPMVPIYLDLYKLNTLTISLTSKCNLRCIYCYARAGLDSNTMSFETAKTAIDFIIKNATESDKDKIKISFHGGGEALVVFPLLKKVVEYAKTSWNGKVRFSIVTNGTLLTENVVKYFKENGFSVTVSMDGPKDVQDSQRPKANGKGSFDDCMNGLRLLKENGFSNVIIRSTITEANVDRIPEMLDIAKEMGASLKVEPVTPTGRGEEDFENLSAEVFLKYYRKARKYAEKIGVRITSTYDHDFTPRTNFCGGNGRMFCVLPKGKITSCSRVTREDDFLADQYIIGELCESEVRIDQYKLSQLQHLSVLNFDQCENCFAKWYCAGGCHATRLSNDMVMPIEHCKIVKSLLWDNLVNDSKKGGNHGQAL